MKWFILIAILGLVAGIFENQIDDAILDKMYGVDDGVEDEDFNDWLLYEADDDEY